MDLKAPRRFVLDSLRICSEKRTNQLPLHVQALTEAGRILVIFSISHRPLDILILNLELCFYGSAVSSHGKLISGQIMLFPVAEKKLIVSLVKETWEEAGLQRHPSYNSCRNIMKFIVSVDLIHLSFNLDPKLC